MIVQEQISDTLTRTYSSLGKMIYGGFPEGYYTEAVDPTELGRTYIETDIDIETESSEDEAYINDILEEVIADE